MFAPSYSNNFILLIAPFFAAWCNAVHPSQSVNSILTLHYYIRYLIVYTWSPIAAKCNAWYLLFVILLIFNLFLSFWEYSNYMTYFSPKLAAWWTTVHPLVSWIFTSAPFLSKILIGYMLDYFLKFLTASSKAKVPNIVFF